MEQEKNQIKIIKRVRVENKKDKIMESMTSNLGHCDRNEGKSWE